MRRELEAKAVEEEAGAEARKAARGAAPLLLLALLLLRYVLSDAAWTPPVRLALAVQLATIGARWGTLSLLAPRDGRPVRTRLWHGPLVTATAWATSAGVGAILLAADGLSSVQLLEITLVCTAVCAIAQQSMAPHLVAYGGYVLIQFGALMFMFIRASDASLCPTMPAMIAIFVGVSGVSAFRANANFRERIRLTFELHESSLRDSLTGLRNRRFAVAFAEQRAAQIVASRRAQHHETATRPMLAFLLVDLDHFKSVNDKYGHDAGDLVLSAFADLATKSLRAHDVIARWGGEEFLVILEVAGVDEADLVAERLRTAIAHAPMIVGPGAAISVTCSIGGTTLASDEGATGAVSWQQSIKRADANLYHAKATGRNRVCWNDREPKRASDAPFFSGSLVNV